MSERYIVNALVRQALVAIQEVMGANGLSAVLRSAGFGHFIDNFPPNDLEPGIKASEYAQLNAAVEDFYGRGARGFLNRIGKASFEYGLKEQSSLMGLAGLAMKALPKRQRIKVVLDRVASALKKTNPQVTATVEEINGKIIYTEGSCAICEGRTDDEPICHLYAGSLMAAIHWATGENIPVVETACKAMGDEHCRFEVRANL